MDEKLVKSCGALLRMESYLRRHCFRYEYLEHDNGDVLALYNEDGRRIFSVVAIPRPKTDQEKPLDIIEKRKPLLLIDHRKDFRDLPMGYEECCNALHDALERKVIARRFEL